MLRYPVVRFRQLGQVGQNIILSRDFNAFYETAVNSATAIAEIARSKDLNDAEQATVNRELGRIRDYTAPTAPPQECPKCPECGAPAAAPAAKDNRLNYALAGAALVAGLSIGALLL